MIAFGCSMTVPSLYRECARRGIERVAEPDSVVIANMATGSVFRDHNTILDEAAALDDLEALVLVHQDAELLDPACCAEIRRVLADESVGVTGAMGVVDARSIAWWEGTVTWSSVTYRYGQSGGGEVPALEWARDRPAAEQRTGEVDTVVGYVLVLSPWAVRTLRFDESLGVQHGHDFDLCLQARAASRKVVTADLPLIHHHSLHLFTKNEPWLAAHARVAEKWEGRMPGGSASDGDWRRRTRRAEAEAGAVRLLVASRQYAIEAELKKYARRLEAITRTASWRLTTPLRGLNQAVRTARAARSGPPEPVGVNGTAPGRAERVLR